MMRRDLQRLDRKEKAAARRGEKPAPTKDKKKAKSSKKTQPRGISYGPDDIEDPTR